MDDSYRRQERLVVFDFDNTIYAQKEYQSKMSCYLTSCPVFQLSDRIFIQQALRGLHAAGVHMGVASFGKKSVIIDCMNQLLYGPQQVPKDGTAYFHERNVITVPDVKAQWKQALNQISSTFKGYVQRNQGDVDAAFEAFLEEQHPERNVKYWCLKLDPSAKLDMIEIIRAYYNDDEGVAEPPIELQDVRFFDDDKHNVVAARAAGVMAHLVPHPGLTAKWWQEECDKIDACAPYFSATTEEQPSKKLKAKEEAVFSDDDE